MPNQSSTDPSVQPSGPRTALITGASSGIGESAARKLAQAGFEVALIARRGERLERIVKDIEATGGRAHAFAADLADDEATADVVEAVLARLGRIDLLVNNAGFSPGAAIEQMSRAEIRNIFEVNLFSALQLAGAVIPQMRLRGSGRIINIGSLAGSVPAPLAIPYAASKVGLHAASDALRLELAPFGIQVVLIIPGFVDTAVFDNAREGAEHLRSDPDNPYLETMFILDDLANDNLKGALSPDELGELILRAATAPAPSARYYAPASALLQSTFMKLLPARLLDAILSRVYKIKKPR